MKRLTQKDVNERLIKQGKGITLLSEYKNNYTKHTFQCSNGHTWFTKPVHVFNGHGCMKCRDNINKLTKETINKRISHTEIKLIGEYNTQKIKTLFQCSNGHQWETTPNHVLHGCNCPFCSNKLLSKDIINKRIVHTGIKLIGEYLNSGIKSLFQCSKGHQWRTLPNHITNFHSGCPECAITGFNKNNPGILYYVNIIGTNIFKIGITNKSVKKRFPGIEYSKLKVIKTWSYEIGKDALEIEQFILKHFRQHKYTGKQILKSGNTELFNCDVMGLTQCN